MRRSTVVLAAPQAIPARAAGRVAAAVGADGVLVRDWVAGLAAGRNVSCPTCLR